MGSLNGWDSHFLVGDDPFTHVLPQENEDVCWICLDEESIGNQLLMSPCKCPRKVHPKCLARCVGGEWTRADKQVLVSWLAAINL